MSNSPNWLRSPTLNTAMSQSIIALIDTPDPTSVTVMVPAGTSKALQVEGQAVIEFEIAERAALGFGIGIASGAADVLIHVGTLNFLLHGMDLLCVDPRTKNSGSLLVYGAVGAGANLGCQHEWWSTLFLAGVPCERVVIPYARQQLPHLLSEWRGSGQWWVVAMPLDVAMYTAPWSDEMADGIVREPTVSARLNIICLGADVRTVCEKFAHRPDVNILPIVDVRAPLTGIEPSIASLNSVIVANSRTAPDAQQLLASYFPNSRFVADASTIDFDGQRR